jgi:hypothetical protein
MNRTRQALSLMAVAAGVAALINAPLATANPLLPGCENTAGGVMAGTQTTECASPGNVQINATPEDVPVEEGFYGFPAFGFFP